MTEYRSQINTGLVSQNEDMFYRRSDMSTAPTISSQFIFDAPAEIRTEKENLILERHFNDLYAVFLHKLTAFALQSSISKEETERLRTFFDELLKAREVL